MYEKHTWVYDEIITEDKLNHIEDGIYKANNNARLITLLKRNDTVLLTWENTGNVLRVRFYGAPIHYIANDIHGSATVSGLLLDWVQGTFLLLNLSEPNTPVITYTTNIEEIYKTDNLYIFGYMQYLHGIESVTIFGTSSFQNTLNRKEV